MDLKKCVKSALNELIQCKDRRVIDLDNMEYFKYNKNACFA